MPIGASLLFGASQLFGASLCWHCSALANIAMVNVRRKLDLGDGHAGYAGQDGHDSADSHEQELDQDARVDATPRRKARRAPTALQSAVKDGLVCKARRPFCLFVSESY